MKVITPTDIEKACGTKSPDHRQVREYMIEQLADDGYLILHVGEDYKGKCLSYSAMMYAHEVWIIRQIGAARCIKHRYKNTPFECLF